MKETQTTNDMQVRRKAFAMLHVPLSMQEKADLGQTIVTLHGQIDKLEAERKAKNDEFKAKLELEELKLKSAVLELRTGTKEERGELAVLFDYKTCNISVRRTDSNELVAERTMSTQERQIEFPETRVPGQLLDVNGRVLELVDDRTDEEKAGKKPKKAKVVALSSVAAPEPADDGIVADPPAPQPAEPSPDDDDIPFGQGVPGEPDDAAEEAAETAGVTRLVEGDAVWLADGDGLAVGPKHTVTALRPGVQKGVVMVDCAFEDGKPAGSFPQHKLTMIAPPEKKAKASKGPKPKYTQGTEVIGPEGEKLLVSASQILSDGRVMYVAVDPETKEKLSYAEHELTKAGGRKPRTPKAPA